MWNTIARPTVSGSKCSTPSIAPPDAGASSRAADRDGHGLGN
jgi:hypothetical protein